MYWGPFGGIWGVVLSGFQHHDDLSHSFWMLLNPLDGIDVLSGLVPGAPLMVGTRHGFSNAVNCEESLTDVPGYSSCWPEGTRSW